MEIESDWLAGDIVHDRDIPLQVDRGHRPRVEAELRHESPEAKPGAYTEVKDSFLYMLCPTGSWPTTFIIRKIRLGWNSTAVYLLRLY